MAFTEAAAPDKGTAAFVFLGQLYFSADFTHYIKDGNPRIAQTGGDPTR